MFWKRWNLKPEYAFTAVVMHVRACVWHSIPKTVGGTALPDTILTQSAVACRMSLNHFFIHRSLLSVEVNLNLMMLNVYVCHLIFLYLHHCQQHLPLLIAHTCTHNLFTSYCARITLQVHFTFSSMIPNSTYWPCWPAVLSAVSIVMFVQALSLSLANPLLSVEHDQTGAVSATIIDRAISVISTKYSMPFPTKIRGGFLPEKYVAVVAAVEVEDVLKQQEEEGEEELDEKFALLAHLKHRSIAFRPLSLGNWMNYTTNSMFLLVLHLIRWISKLELSHIHHNPMCLNL